MTDESIAARIERLVAEEHDLRSREQVEREDVEGLAADRERLGAVEVEQDRCWDLLRQRRALSSAGGDPDDARCSRRGDRRGLRAVAVRSGPTTSSRPQPHARPISLVFDSAPVSPRGIVGRWNFLDGLSWRVWRREIGRAAGRRRSGAVYRTEIDHLIAQRRLVEYWRSDYDWRAQEAAINALPSRFADVDGIL